MGLLLFYAFLSIFFSFLCSILEAVLLSVTSTFINIKKKEGRKFAQGLEELKRDVDQPLIAILTLNTIAHTVGAILVGVQAKVAYAEIYGQQQRSIFGIQFTEDLMVGVVSTLMTILILVASEIIPKTIGATYWRQLARISTILLKAMVWLLKVTGIMWLLQLFTRLVGKSEHGSVLSREDFTAMADIAHEEGVFEESESKVIKKYAAYDCILIDELGYVEVEPVQVGLFFTLMHKRHKHKTTLITSNLGFAQWSSFLNNNQLTAALIDRLTENSHVLNMKKCISLRLKLDQAA